MNQNHQTQGKNINFLKEINLISMPYITKRNRDINVKRY